jgi:tetratricopeptide (TPR) repeat protein
MALSEIEKLERRYAENPHGLTFAPLAEVHRKNGDVQRALELLKPGLQNHPDYIPASIVLGRCHLDLSDLPAAETAFTHVLALDGENVIALKALADINERLHRFDDAERWLNTLLSLDRSNDDARAQLARLELARRQTDLGSTAPGAAEAAFSEIGTDLGATAQEPAGAEEATVVESFGAEVVTGQEPGGAWIAEPGAPAAAEATPLVLEDLEPSALDGFDAPPAGLERDEPVGSEEPIEPIPDLVGREVDLADAVADDFRVETSEEIVLESAGGSEFQVPDASQELFSRAPESSPFAEVVSVPPASYPSEPMADAGPTRGPEPEPRAIGEDEPTVPDFAPILIEAAGMVPPRHEEEEDASGSDRADATPVAQPMAADEPEPMAADQPEAAYEPEPMAAYQPEEAHEPEPVADQEREPVAVEAPDQATTLEPALAPEPMDQRAPDSAEQPAASASALLFEPPTPAAEPPPPPEPIPTFAPPEPEPVVTETMAEVLLQQGHAADALRVYRELARRSGDPRLQQRVAELESAPLAAPRVVRYSAAETGGRSVGDTLRAILAARLPSRPAAPAVRQPSAVSGSEGAPTRPAAEALSLSSVFGEETPTAPAVPAAPAERDRVSFDDFYGGATPTQAPRGPRAAEPKSDDLDEFHAWLQNLKR